MKKAITRKGKYGTLYHYTFKYRQRNDPGCPQFTWSCWAYNSEHALEKFYADDEDCWEILSGPHRTKKAC